ncbi:hypothetical protein ACHHYP_01129 [Achlya hypogyna]|uniref:Dynein heavy chain coiled coil stalk domain-containing protein n=1 Tax=Achlya hypogyna TaxID=1202772 RepID=A0A1V9Z974_ACHHY|nr:hypothetical protein ACHHYP_01129 [Achlya hypogyna]
MSSTLHYPYRPPRARSSNHESLHKATPARPVMNHAFHGTRGTVAGLILVALTREEMGWHGSPTRQSLKDAKSLRPKQLKTSKSGAKLNSTQKREYGWDTSFPAEYSLTNLARDFKDTLSYTQGKIKEARETKMVLERGHRLVSQADVQHNLSTLQSAFNCQQPASMPTADPKLEIHVMKCILIREGLVSRLKGTVQRIQIGDLASLKVQNGDSLLSILLQTRDASVAVIQALYDWQSQLPAPQTYIYSGKSYAHRMLDDLNFLADVPRLAEALGVAPESMVRNPFMMPVAIPNRDLEPVASQRAPPYVSTPSAREPPPPDMVAQADAFLVWCCLHLDELPTEDASPTVPETSDPAPASGMSTLEVLQWQTRAEMQLKLLSMPMESSLGVHVMDSSPLMKRKGYLPSLSTSPPKTLKDLIHTVHEGPSAKKPSVLHVTVPYTSAKYAKVKPRVSAESFPHQKKPPRAVVRLICVLLFDLRAQPSKHVKRLKKPSKKADPVVFTLNDLSVTHLELETLSRDEAPPQVVALIVATVMILVTPGDLVPKDVGWATARTLLSNGKQLLRTLHTFLEGPPVATFKMKALSPFLTNSKFRPEFLIPISVPAAVLCAWVLETVGLQGQPGAKSASQLLEPGAESSADVSDLLMYLETDDTNPQTRDHAVREPSTGLRSADVLIIQDPVADARDELGMDPDPDTVVLSGSWSYHGLTYSVSFYLVQIEPSCLLQVKLFETKSAEETHAHVTEDEIHALFGPHVLAYAYERAWVPLCQAILDRLDHVMDPGAPPPPRLPLGPINQHDDEDLLNALDTSRSIEVPLPQLAPTPRPDRKNLPLPTKRNEALRVRETEVEAALKIQCATRQRLSRERVKRLRRHKQEKLKNPTLFMSAEDLRQYEEYVLQIQRREGVARHKALQEAQDAAVLRIQCASRQKLSRQIAAAKRREARQASHGSQKGASHPRRSLVEQQVDFEVDINPAFQTIQTKAKVGMEYLEEHRLRYSHLVAHPVSTTGPQRLSVPDPLELYPTDAAAVRIQCLARQRFARKRATARREDLRQLRYSRSTPSLSSDEMTDAAVRIQCLARQRQAKKCVAAKRRAASRHIGLTKDYDKQIAAVRIQCLARQRAAKERVAALRREHDTIIRELAVHHDKDAAALRIQCLARQRAAKHKVEKKRRESSKRHADAAAVRIQCMIRQRTAKQHVAIKRQQAHVRKIDAAALRIQCSARQRLARNAVARKREQLKPQMPARSLSFGASDKDHAAVRIQCIARQRAAKKEVALRRQSMQQPPNPVPKPVYVVSDKDTAALHIQCLVRQRAARKRVSQYRAERLALVLENDEDDDYAADDFGSPPPSRDDSTTAATPMIVEIAPPALCINAEAADTAAHPPAGTPFDSEPQEQTNMLAKGDEYSEDDFATPPPSRGKVSVKATAEPTAAVPLSARAAPASVDAELSSPLTDSCLRTEEYPAQPCNGLDGAVLETTALDVEQASNITPQYETTHAVELPLGTVATVRDVPVLEVPFAEATLCRDNSGDSRLSSSRATPPCDFSELGSLEPATADETPLTAASPRPHGNDGSVDAIAVPVLPLPLLQLDSVADVTDAADADDYVLPLHVPSPVARSTRGGELSITCDDAPAEADMSIVSARGPPNAAPEQQRADFELTPRLPEFGVDDDTGHIGTETLEVEDDALGGVADEAADSGGTVTPQKEQELDGPAKAVVEDENAPAIATAQPPLECGEEMQVSIETLEAETRSLDGDDDTGKASMEPPSEEKAEPAEPVAQLAESYANLACHDATALEIKLRSVGESSVDGASEAEDPTTGRSGQGIAFTSARIYSSTENDAFDDADISNTPPFTTTTNEGPSDVSVDVAETCDAVTANGVADSIVAAVGTSTNASEGTDTTDADEEYLRYCDDDESLPESQAATAEIPLLSMNSEVDQAPAVTSASSDFESGPMTPATAGPVDETLCVTDAEATPEPATALGIGSSASSVNEDLVSAEEVTAVSPPTEPVNCDEAATRYSAADYDADTDAKVVIDATDSPGALEVASRAVLGDASFRNWGSNVIDAPIPGLPLAETVADTNTPPGTSQRELVKRDSVSSMRTAEDGSPVPSTRSTDSYDNEFDDVPDPLPVPPTPATRG